MPKPESQIDAIEEVENILNRLMPAAMSDSATRANESMIENLAGMQSAAHVSIADGRAWWKVGIAASILLGAGLAFMSLANLNAAGDLQYVDSNYSKEITPVEQFIEEPDGQPQVVVEYREEDVEVFLDRKTDIEIEVGQYSTGQIVTCNSGIF